WLSASLSLNGHIRSRRGTEILRPHELPNNDERKSSQCEQGSCPRRAFKLHPCVLLVLARCGCVRSDAPNDRRARKVERNLISVKRRLTWVPHSSTSALRIRSWTMRLQDLE